MRNTHQQLLPFQAMNGLAQRATADSVGTRQFRLGNLAARRNLAFDDSRLNTPEDVFGKRFRISLR